MMNSIYLYVALIGIGFVLFALTRRKPDAVVGQAVQPIPVSQEARDMRVALDEFMNELERDNARLLDSFTQLQIEYKQGLNRQQRTIEELEARVADLEAEVAKMAQAAQQAVVPAPEQQGEQEVDVQSASRPPAFSFNEKYARVVELSLQGLTAEQIARATGIGHGEIQMVLGLAKREES